MTRSVHRVYRWTVQCSVHIESCVLHSAQIIVRRSTAAHSQCADRQQPSLAVLLTGVVVQQQTHPISSLIVDSWPTAPAPHQTLFTCPPRARRATRLHVPRWYMKRGSNLPSVCAGSGVDILCHSRNLIILQGALPSRHLALAVVDLHTHTHTPRCTRCQWSP